MMMFIWQQWHAFGDLYFILQGAVGKVMPSFFYFVLVKHDGYVHPFSITDFYISIVFLAFGHIGKHVCYLFPQFTVTFFIFLLPAFLPSYFWCILWKICLRWVRGTKEKHVQIVQYSLRPHSDTLYLYSTVLQ